VLPGYDNTAFGITGTWNLSKALHVSYGVFDGNQARGVATGLRGPEFNGYYFHITEIGTNWRSGPERKPGSLAVGGWRQTGRLTTDDGLIEQDGAEGAYVVGTQQLWYRDAHPINDAGVTGFFQFVGTTGRPYPSTIMSGLG
jgi:porin